MVVAALEGNEALGASLGVTVPSTWPPEYLDPQSLEFVLRGMVEGEAPSAWWLYFVILRHAPDGRMLIGSVGYKGPPSDGMVEVGYGIVRDQHRQGYASEAVRGLLARAFGTPDVTRVTAETYPELVGSLGVLRRCGFRFIGDGSEPGVIRFEITGAEYAIQVGEVTERS